MHKRHFFISHTCSFLCLAYLSLSPLGSTLYAGAPVESTDASTELLSPHAIEWQAQRELKHVRKLIAKTQEALRKTDNEANSSLASSASLENNLLTLNNATLRLGGLLEVLCGELQQANRQLKLLKNNATTKEQNFLAAVKNLQKENKILKSKHIESQLYSHQTHSFLTKQNIYLKSYQKQLAQLKEERETLKQKLESLLSNQKEADSSSGNLEKNIAATQPLSQEDSSSPETLITLVQSLEERSKQRQEHWNQLLQQQAEHYQSQLEDKDRALAVSEQNAENYRQRESVLSLMYQEKFDSMQRELANLSQKLEEQQEQGHPAIALAQEPLQPYAEPTPPLENFTDSVQIGLVTEDQMLANELANELWYYQRAYYELQTELIDQYKTTQLLIGQLRDRLSPQVAEQWKELTADVKSPQIILGAVTPRSILVENRENLTAELFYYLEALSPPDKEHFEYSDIALSDDREEEGYEEASALHPWQPRKGYEDNNEENLELPLSFYVDQGLQHPLYIPGAERCQAIYATPPMELCVPPFLPLSARESPEEAFEYFPMQPLEQ